MKTALLHYWLTNMRGGEKVLAEFCTLYPDADIFTHAWDPVKVREPFLSHKITETFIGRLPLAKRHCQKYLPLMPAALARLDLSAYDLILSSESGPAKGIRKPAHAKHVCYCHTPMRYLWDMFEDYYQAAGLSGKAAMLLFRNALRRYDLRSADAVDHFIANSAFVAERIRRIYRRDAVVIHPPVDVSFFSAAPACRKEDFYLFLGELTPYKKPDLAIEACKRLGKRLVVAGDGPMRKDLEKHAGNGISFAGRPSREDLRGLFLGARALLFPGLEDFGIVPLEAQAAGTPVIAFGAGGALETVQPGRTGLFFDRLDADALADAIVQFESRDWDSSVCAENAAAFSPERFRAEMERFLADAL